MKINILTILICVYLVACGEKKTTVKETQSTDDSVQISLEVSLTDAQRQQAQLILQPITKGKMSASIQLNGVIDVPPTAVASVSLPLGGYIQELNLIPGKFVSKGVILATVKDPMYIQLQEEYLTTKAKLQYVLQDLDRQKLLLDQDATSRKAYQQIQSEYLTSTIQLKALSEKLKLINIDPLSLTAENLTSTIRLLSPISGYVSAVNVNKGKYVTPTEIVLEIIDPNDIHAAVTIFEKDLTYINPGMKGVVMLNNQPAIPYPVTVIAASKNLNEDKTGLVHCHFDQVPKQLLPGMFLTATIYIKTDEEVLVPVEAIQRFQGEDYIFIEKGKNTFEVVKIKVTNKNKTVAAVANLEALNWVGKKIVVKNGYSLLGKWMNKAEE